MGRIKGPSSVFRERLVEKDESYTANQPNYLREGIKDIGAVLTISEKIYGSPLLKDAAAGLFDLFSSDKEKVVETIKGASAAEQMKEAAMSRRKGAMAEYDEEISKPDPVEELDIGVQTELTEQRAKGAESPSIDENGMFIIDSLDVSSRESAERLLAHGASLGETDPRKVLKLVNSMSDPVAIRTLNEMQGRVTPGRGQFLYDLLYARIQPQRTGAPTVSSEGVIQPGRSIDRAPRMEAPIPMEQQPGIPLQGATPPTGPTATVATEEITEETPTATRLIGDDAPVDLPGAVTAENFRKIQDDVASDYITYKPEINDAIDKLKAIYGTGAFGSTPQEVQATIRTISQSFGGGVPAQGIEVPDIAGMSIQEAEGVVMEIAASNASMAAKTKAMRKVLKQAGDLDDVVPAWMARGGSLGYLDRDMAADRLRKAFTGMIPKPKAARAPSLSEQIKLARLPDIQEGDKLKNVKARQGVIREELALPHDIKKKLLDATKGYKDLKFPKTGGGGRSGAGKKKLDELEKRLERNANSDRKFFQSSQERIKTQVTGLQNLTVAKIMDPMSNQQIATDYGPDLAKYLQDVRNAKTDAEKQSALKKAKASIRNDLRARAKALKANQVKLAELVRRLNVELLQKNLKKKEATLREINELWADIQKGL